MAQGHTDSHHRLRGARSQRVPTGSYSEAHADPGADPGADSLAIADPQPHANSGADPQADSRTHPQAATHRDTL